MVGSIPSLTRRGRPSSSCSASRPSGSTSTAFRVRSGIRAMLDCRLRSAVRPDVEFLVVPLLMASSERKPRLKKLRVLFVLLGPRHPLRGLDGLRDDGRGLPGPAGDLQLRPVQGLEEQQVLVDANGEEIGTLTSDQNKILLSSGQISPNIKNAVVSIEDARFYEHTGVDFQGIGRALVKDILSMSAAQGASTITQQFVKNALEAQGDRSLFVKFKEAALAYRLERHWSKDKILTEYLNTVYFGQGAYGIEAAARTYFGDAHPGCGTETEPCACGAGALGGGAAGRDHPVALGLRPEGLPGKRPRPGATSCSNGWPNRATSPKNSCAKARSRPCPPRRQHRTAEPRLRGPLLHRLPAPAAGRTLRRREGLLRRPESQVDARPAAAGSGRRSGQLLPRLLAGDRLGGRDRQPQRRDQGDGRRPGLRHQALQPGDPGSPPARAPRSSPSP